MLKEPADIMNKQLKYQEYKSQKKKKKNVNKEVENTKIIQI